MNDGNENIEIKVFEALRDTIQHVVSNSIDVQTLVQILHDRQIQENFYEHMEVMDMRSLLTPLLTRMASAQSQKPIPDKLEPVQKAKQKPAQWIDGKILSEEEELFEEYYRQWFDETAWRKENNIRL